MNQGPGATLQSVTTLRETGMVLEAAGQIRQLLQGRSLSAVEGTVLVEALRLALLQRQPDDACKAYIALQQLPGFSGWELEFLTRLHIMSGHTIPELNLQSLPTRSQWASRYLDTGEDLLHQVELVDYSVKCVVEAALYRFSVRCPSCDHRYQIEVYKTLMIDRQYLCPECLARQHVEYDSLRAFLHARVPHPQLERIHRADEVLHSILLQLNADTLRGEQFTLVARYLSHDYVVALNELAAESFVSPLSGAI